MIWIAVPLLPKGVGGCRWRCKCGPNPSRSDFTTGLLDRPEQTGHRNPATLPFRSRRGICRRHRAPTALERHVRGRADPPRECHGESARGGAGRRVPAADAGAPPAPPRCRSSKPGTKVAQGPWKTLPGRITAIFVISAGHSKMEFPTFPTFPSRLRRTDVMVCPRLPRCEVAATRRPCSSSQVRSPKAYPVVEGVSVRPGVQRCDLVGAAMRESFPRPSGVPTSPCQWTVETTSRNARYRLRREEHRHDPRCSTEVWLGD
jgi:hypothetical protein